MTYFSFIINCIDSVFCKNASKIKFLNENSFPDVFDIKICVVLSCVLTGTMMK